MSFSEALGLFSLHPIVDVYASIPLTAVDPRVPLLLRFPPHPRVSAKSTFFVFTAPLISSCFGPPLVAPDIAWCAEGMQLPKEFPHLPPSPDFTLTNWPRVPLPLTSLCSPWRLGPTHELAGPVHLADNSTKLWEGRTLHSEFLCKKQQAGEQNRPRRRKERERERDRVWAFGGGFWLKIEPLSFSPFASFFVWQALAIAAIQVVAKMKEKYLCLHSIGCSLTLGAWDILHNFVLDDWLSVL